MTSEKIEYLIRCLNCNCKGHIFDVGSWYLLLIPIFWPILFFERNNKYGLSRECCPSCKGDGYKIINVKGD